MRICWMPVVFVGMMARVLLVVLAVALSSVVVVIFIFQLLYGSMRMEWVDSFVNGNGNLRSIELEDGSRIGFRFDDYYTPHGLYLLEAYRKDWMVSTTTIDICAWKTDSQGIQIAKRSYQAVFNSPNSRKVKIPFAEEFAPRKKHEHLVLEFQVKSVDSDGNVIIRRGEIKFESRNVFHSASV